MKIFLSGVETKNKGAELMLYAILQEVEKEYPNAIVYMPRHMVTCGLQGVKTSLDFRFLPCGKFEDKFRISGLFGKLHLPYWLMPHKILLGKMDYYIDGSGFKFSDQFNISNRYANYLNAQLKQLKKEGTRIVYLPQAFGPFEKAVSKKILTTLNCYASVIMPREKVSFSFIKESGLVDIGKVKMNTDFTSLVAGVFPSNYDHLRNKICVIPNRQMINKKVLSLDDYISFLQTIIIEGKKTGFGVYLLNHEGKGDELLCHQINERLQDKVEIVSGLNALEVKGLISSAFLVISSRFHGIASALNTCVPCLATSWSHKYKELFADYQMTDCILPLNDNKKTISMIDDYIREEKNKEIRTILSQKIPQIKERTIKMWNLVWDN